MNRKRIHRYRIPSHSFQTLFTTTTTAILVTAAIVLAILSPTVYSRVYQPTHKLQSSCATIVPRQTVAVSRHFRSTKTHVTTGTDSEYSRSMTTMHHRKRRYVARLIGETVTMGQSANNTSNHTRCYKVKFTTPIPTTKRWSPILKTYPSFPVTNITVASVITTKVTKITKVTKASTTTETTTEPPEETQDTEEKSSNEETSSNEEDASTEEPVSTKETSSTEETTNLEETTLVEDTTTKKKTKKTTNESAKTEKPSITTVKSSNPTEKASKTTEKSSKAAGKPSKTTKKMTKTTEAYDEVVTCSEDPSCDEEPSCLDDEVTSAKPKKTIKPPPVKKSTGVIKPKNRSKKLQLDSRRLPPTIVHYRSSPSSAIITLDDSLWSDDGLNYESP